MRILDLRNGFDSSEIEKLITAEETQAGVDSVVAGIFSDVRARGDAALCDYTQRFETFRLTPGSIRLTDEEVGRHSSAGSAGMLIGRRGWIKSVSEFRLQ